MKNNKSAQFLIAILFLTAILYLAGSFAAASFNIAIWESFGRGIISAIWILGICFIGTIMNENS